MLKKFFNKKRVIICFIIYLLITAFIFAQSLASGSKSAETSDLVGGFLSSAVSFITGGKVNLEDGDKTEGLYPESISITGAPARLVIGKTYTVNATLNPLGSYPLSKLSYSSSDSSILKVSQNGTLTPLSSGACSITVTDTLSGVSASKSFYVSSEVYTHQITFRGVASNESQDATDSVYYSTSTSTGAMYVLGYQSDLKTLQATVTEGDADILLTNGMVWFVTKKAGPLTIKLHGEYKNANGDQVVENSYTLDVKEKAFPAYSTDFTFLNTPQTIELERGETTDLLTNSSTYFSGLENVQKALYLSYDNQIIHYSASGQTITLTANKEGSTPFTFYSAGPNGLKVTTVNVVVKKGLPAFSQIITPNTTIKNGVPTRITVIGDDTTYLASEFDWTVVGTEDYTFNGDTLTVNDNGTITLKGTHKTISGFSVERTINVEYSYGFKVRKFIGHFLLFLTLSVFAYVVYKRLAELTFPKKVMIMAVVFTLLVGFITAGISELLQLGVFTAFRGSSFIDVLIDFAGYFVGTAVCFGINLIPKKKG